MHTHGVWILSLHKSWSGKWIFIANFSDLALLVADALGAPNRVDSQRGLGVIKGKIWNSKGEILFIAFGGLEQPDLHCQPQEVKLWNGQWLVTMMIMIMSYDDIVISSECRYFCSFNGPSWLFSCKYWVFHLNGSCMNWVFPCNSFSMEQVYF